MQEGRIVTSKQAALWANKVVRACLLETDDVDIALCAADYIVATQPFPGEVEIEQDEADDDGNNTIPVDLNVFLAHDIHNRQAQGILNRSLQAVKGLTASARKDLATALKRGLTDTGQAILLFIDKYRNQLARLLTTTQLASLLEGAREVSAKVPTLAVFPGAVPPPPTLTPQDAVSLVERLEKLTKDKQAEAIYKLPTDQQVYVAQALATKEAGPPVIPPIVLPGVEPSGPEGIHFPTIEEAIKQLAEKNVLDRQRYDALDSAARAKAFTVANVEAEETLTKLRDSLAENVREGADYETWRKKVMEDVEQGTFLSDAHQETVFRTNVQTAFSDGQAAVLSHPLVRNGFPYSDYSAIHDQRVRPNHLALEQYGIGGTNIYRNDDPVFQLFRPPWDYNDRCSWTPITVRQAAERGIKEAQIWLDTGTEPTPPAYVPMPPFQPPPGFNRAVSSAPLSVQLSMQPLAYFSTKKPEEESETSELFGQPEVGGIGSATLDTAKEPRKTQVGRHTKKVRAGKSKSKHRPRSLFKRLRVKRRWKPAVSLSVDAEGHQHKGKGEGGGQFVSSGEGGWSGTSEPSKRQPKELPKGTLYQAAARIIDKHHKNMRAMMAKLFKGEYDPKDALEDTETYMQEALDANARAWAGRFGRFQSNAQHYYHEEAFQSSEWEAVKSIFREGRDKQAEHIEEIASYVKSTAEWPVKRKTGEGIQVGADDWNAMNDEHDKAMSSALQTQEKLYKALDVFDKKFPRIKKPEGRYLFSLFSVDAEGHQHKGKGAGGGQFTGTGNGGSATTTAKSKPDKSKQRALLAVLKSHGVKATKRTWRIVKAVEHKVMIGFHKAKELAVAAAKERGASEETANRVGKILGTIDTISAWTVNMPATFAATGSMTAAKVSSWIPVASLAYIGYSTARNPAATVRAAQGLIKGKYKKKEETTSAH